MPELNKHVVLDALRTVLEPQQRKDLVSLGLVKDVIVSGEQVRVIIEVPPPLANGRDVMRKGIETAVTNLRNSARVQVEFRTPLVAARETQNTLLADVENIIAVGAGKGGVGKSTVAVLAAVGLARTGARVGLLDADVYGPSIPKLMGVEDAQPTVVGQGESILPVESHDVRTMSIGYVIPRDQAVIWRGPMIQGAVKQFLEQVEWGPLDYLIVDLPPGTGDIPLTLSQTIPMTGAVVVCTPQAVALSDAIRAAGMYRRLNIEVIGLVENMSYFIAPDTGIEYDLFGKGGAEKAAAELGVPFLGSIPINASVRISGDAGRPADIFTQEQQGLRQAVMDVVERLAAEVANQRTTSTAGPRLTIEK